MKRTLWLPLVLAMVLSLTACGSSTDETNNAPDTETQDTAEPVNLIVFAAASLQESLNQAIAAYDQNMWNHGDSFVNDWMNHIHNKCTCESPVDGKFQTYISVKIKRLIAIVPPFIVKYFLQNKSCNVFQNGSQ